MAADSKARFLQDAEKYVLHGKVHQAIGEYLKIVKCDPEDVLTLNTIGDLYLRQNKVTEANRYFSQVAENYVRNNFFLKALAVYKKILNADPNNFDINLTMAALYAKQGSSIDARNQYLKVAVLLEKAGRSKEILDIYEKVVDLDPANFTIERKLAELQLANGEPKQAHVHFTGAARAQIKARDLAGAMDSFGRALQLDPMNVNALSGLLECCQEIGNVIPALDRLTKSVELAPDNLDIREMLGQAHLAANDPEAAAKAFQIVVSMNESRYEGFFAVTQALIDRETYEKAISCLDTIMPILITRRETERAAQLYEQILQRCPSQILPLIKLAAICSATGDQPRYLDALDKIADHYLEQKSPIEALEYLEKIIHVTPDSDKHRKLHQEAFTEAYPDTPYVPPAEPAEPVIAASPAAARTEPDAAPSGSSSEIVEVDLMLNYGLVEKALSLLKNLEIRDPNDREVRIRLLNIFKAGNKFAEAAEQCLLLAVLYRRSKNEEEAQNYLDEAKQLVPDAAENEQDLEEFARLRGVDVEPLATLSSETEMLKADSEVDLSADLMDIFFVGDQDSENGEDSELQQIACESPEAVAEDYPQDIPQAPSKSIQEQLQEVDFYIRLGFHDEALAKLTEIAKTNPDHPELRLRYQKLGNAGQNAGPGPEAFAKSDLSAFEEPSGPMPHEGIDVFQKLEVDGAPGGFAIINPESTQTRQDSEPIAPASFAIPETTADRRPQEPRVETFIPLESDKLDFQGNEMFADLMDDIGATTDQEVSTESFEDHFALGTAYREMDLMDDAIREFEMALKSANAQKDSQRIIQCCGMLSTCFLKKSMSRSALRWCQTGLSIADISSHEAMALRYDMGIAHSMSGNIERALECLERIFGSDPSYRDVAQRIDELKSGFNRHAP